LRSLSDEQLWLFHQASLEILARTGVRFHTDEAIDLFRKGGAHISDGNRVRIPAHLVEWALRAAPKNIIIYNRHGQRAMSLGGYHSYFGPGSDAMHIYDLETGQRRQAVLQDVVNAARLVDALPHLDYAMSQYLPCDVAPERYERCQIAAMLQETTKPIVFVGLEKASTVYAIEMACAVAGGLDELALRPFIVNYVNFASPFNHNQESVERLLFAAERNIPTIYTPGRARGSEAPMTEAGAMALVNAGQMAGLVLAQLKQEGAPFLWANPNGGTLDMSSLVSAFASPDSGPTSWDLAHFYRVPIFGFAGFSDAKICDAQAAAEVALTLFENALNGANLVHDLGLLDSGMTGSMELLVLCDEIISWLRHYLRRIEISDETLALDVIHQASSAGNFLESEHTLRHCREAWRPGLFDRNSYRRWADKGSLTLQERATQKARQIIQDHRAEPLSPDVKKAIEKISDD
jgi:trimethylamine--corrinoid protein Co-methyltransferase